MLALFRKPVWLICLMVFTIGWSSVSVASIKSMNLPMQSANQQMSAHCQKMNQPHSSAQMQHMKVRAENQQPALPTCISVSDMGHMQHHHCADCGSVLCQPLVFGLAVQPFALVMPPIEYKNNSRFSLYQAQHLAGYAQEILRPPKV